MKPRRGLLQQYASIFSLLARLADILSVILAGWITYFIRFDTFIFASRYNGVILLGALLTALIFPLFDLYDSWRGRFLGSQFRRLCLGWFSVVLVLLLFSVVLKTTIIYSRIWMTSWITLSLLFLILFRLSITLSLRLLRKQGWNQRRVVVIGEREFAKQLADQLEHITWSGLKVIEIISLESLNQSVFRGIPLLMVPTNLYSHLQQLKVDEIWITLPLEQEGKIAEFLYDLRHLTAPIRFVPEIKQFSVLKHPIHEIAGIPVIEISSIPLMGASKFVKLCEDYILGTIFFLIALPIMLLVALGIKLTSKGPILFKQLRHGCDGRKIKVYKFRTMVAHCETAGQVTQAKKNDTRITKFGRFLRKTSLDELPQLFNVLQGRMSIVGPRPHAVEHNELYKDLVTSYMQRHKVKPGLTGWAQVNGWRGETDILEKMQKRVEYDLYYIENWSLWIDLKIIFLTIVRGLKGANAY